jgi:hypothetical protein
MENLLVMRTREREGDKWGNKDEDFVEIITLAPTT